MHLAYPKRPPFFAMHVMQALMETEAAKSMGRDACLLVAFIATYEDKLRYAKPVQFRCSHLVTMMNFRDWRGLDKARKAAIEAGWLQYEPTTNGSARAAKYFVTIPSVDVDSRPLAEIAYGRVDGLAYGRVDGLADGLADGPAYGRVDGRVDGLAYLSILDPIPSPNPEPNPNPKKTKAAKPPSFDALDFVLPEEINTPEMQEAWRIWVRHRNELKKRLTPTSCQQQAAQFVEWGVDRSIAAIRYTVKKGWQGLREDEETTKASRQKNLLDGLLKSPDAQSSIQATPEPPKERPKTQAEIELERYKALQDAKLKNPRAFGSVTARPVALPPPPPSEEPPKPKEPIPLPTEQEIELRRKTIERLTGVAE